MYLVQILLPLYDNDGTPFDARMYAKLRGDLAARFGGVTAYTRAPARGVWIDDAGEPARDDIVIFEVMTGELEKRWWRRFRSELEAEFRQDTVIIRAITTALL